MNLPRRTFLRQVGTVLALPLINSLAPARLGASPNPSPGAVPPLRTAFVYHPNGVVLENWRLGRGSGLPAALPPTLQPLESLRSFVNVVSGLSHKNAYGNGDGAGDHARATATFLTGLQAKKTGGTDVRLGRSIDQIMADHLSGNTRFRSLELSASDRRTSGTCDSGYSCAYQYNLAWKDETTPLQPEINPREVFKKLFGTGDPHETALMERRLQRRQSILDALREDTARLSRRVSAEDRDHLEAYYESIRSVERRLDSREAQPSPPEGAEVPPGIPASYGAYLDLMFDMMILAFQSDNTRVATFLQAHDGSNRTFPEIDVRGGHHHLSHHKGEQAKIEHLKKIDAFYLRHFARFVQRLAETHDGEGRRLIDSTMVVYGGGIADGNRHDHSDLPVLLAGGPVEGGRHLRFDDVPMCNLYLGMLATAGHEVPRFGDSTGALNL